MGCEVRLQSALPRVWGEGGHRSRSSLGRRSEEPFNDCETGVALAPPPPRPPPCLPACLQECPTFFPTIEDFLWLKLSLVSGSTTGGTTDSTIGSTIGSTAAERRYALPDLQRYLAQYPPAHYSHGGREPLLYVVVLLLTLQFRCGGRWAGRVAGRCAGCLVVWLVRWA